MSYPGKEIRPAIRLKGQKLKRLIEEVLNRDNYSCKNPECPGGFPIDYPHHIIFRSQGGSDVKENLITYCQACHGKQHGINYVQSSLCTSIKPGG